MNNREMSEPPTNRTRPGREAPKRWLESSLNWKDWAENTWRTSTPDDYVRKLREDFEPGAVSPPNRALTSSPAQQDDGAGAS